jgi:hypothetical protein
VPGDVDEHQVDRAATRVTAAAHQGGRGPNVPQRPRGRADDEPMPTNPRTEPRYCLTCQRQTDHRPVDSHFPGAQWRCTEHRIGLAGRRHAAAPKTAATR